MVDDNATPRPTTHREALRVVARFQDLGEAELAVSALRAAGIPAHARDRQTVGVDWFLTHALGGIRVEVPASHAAAASELLAGAGEGIEPLSDEEAGALSAYRQRRRRRGLWALAAFFAPWTALGWWLDRKGRGRREEDG